MSKDAPNDQRGSTLEDIATGLGTLLGKAERKWRESGASEAIERTVTEVRDRAAALVDEMNLARKWSGAPPAEPAPASKSKAKPRTARRAGRTAAKRVVKQAIKKAAKTSRPARRARKNAKAKTRR